MKKNQSQLDYQKRKKENGICIVCSEPQDPASANFCAKHLARHNEKALQHYYKNKSAATYSRKISGFKTKIKLMLKLGGLKCAMCGETDFRVLSFDHVDGHLTPLKERASRTPRGLNTVENKGVMDGTITTDTIRIACMNCQVRNEYRRGNRQVYPEVLKMVVEAGGTIPD